MNAIPAYQTTALAELIEAHGFLTVTQPDGAVTALIPYQYPSTGERGVDRIEVRSMDEAREALGY